MAGSVDAGTVSNRFDLRRRTVAALSLAGAAFLVAAGASSLIEAAGSSAASTVRTVAVIVAIISGAIGLAVGILDVRDHINRWLASCLLFVGGAGAATALAVELSSGGAGRAGPSHLVAVAWAAGGAVLVAASFWGAIIPGPSSAPRSRFMTPTTVISATVIVVVMNAAAGLAAAGTASAPGGTVANPHSPSASSELSSLTPAWLDTDLAALRVAVPGEVLSSCSTTSPSELIAVADVVTAALRCAPEAGLVATYWLVPDPWSAHRVLAGLSSGSTVGAGSPGCWDGKPGDAQYAHGLVSCRVDGGQATVAWTDDRIAAVGVATMSVTDLGRVVDWWWNVGMTVSVRATPSPDAGGADLLDLVSPWLRAACSLEGGEDGRAKGDPVGAVIALGCTPTDAVAGPVTWYRFADRAALDAWFNRSVAAAGIPAGSHGCYSGSPGLATWATGRAACGKRSPDGNAFMIWTNERTLTFGTLSGRGPSVPDLFAWWQGNGVP